MPLGELVFLNADVLAGMSATKHVPAEDQSDSLLKASEKVVAHGQAFKELTIARTNDCYGLSREEETEVRV